MAKPRNTEAALIRELRQSEAWLRLATKAGNIGLWGLDPRTNRVSYSAQWKKQIGYEEHEIADEFSEWQDRLHPEDLARSLQAVQDFFAGRRPSYSVEFRLRHKDGSYRWILAQGSFVHNENGEPERLVGAHVDITAQKEAEEASRTEIRGIHDCLVDGLMIVDAGTTAILRVNLAMCGLFGYSEQELRARRVIDLHPPEAPAGSMRYLESSFALGEKLARGIPCLRADGSVFLAEIASHPIDLGGRKCLIGFIRDATDILRNEQKLQISERMLQEQLAELADVYRNSPVGLCVLDRNFRYLRINERLAEINGRPIEQHLGHTIYETVPELADHFAKMWRPIFETGEPLLDVEIRGETAKAPHTQRSWLASFFPMKSATGEVTAIMSSVVEISDRKRAEEQLRESEVKYRALVETTDTGFVIVDDGGKVIDANQEYVRQTGRESLSEIRGHPVTDWTASYDLARNLEALSRCVAEGFTRNLVVDYASKADQPKTIEINATVVRMEGGTRILALTRDITERNRTEKEKEMLHAQLRQSQKMEAVGRFSGGVAHDFNNLLTVIEGNAAMASRALDGASTMDCRERISATIAEIQQAARRASHLTSQLLAFSRKRVTDVQVLDASAIVRDTETMLRRLIREDIVIRIACEPGEHLIEADRSQVEQVLVNLAVNASDAMPDGGRLSILVGDVSLDEEHVKSHAGAAAGSYVVIAVADTGIGMDQSTLDHLFEPFFTTKPLGAGTGLGLAIVYGIVNQARGHITVTSEPGRGSTFRLHFPGAHGEIRRTADLPALDWKRGDETILICEDEPSVRRLIHSILTESGYTVIEAEDGEQALQLAREHAGAFRLLITDVVMPGMKGDSVAAAIQRDQPGVKVLFMSGYASDLLSFERSSEGAMDFLQKPCRPQVLLQRVREILDRTGK